MPSEYYSVVAGPVTPLSRPVGRQGIPSLAVTESTSASTCIVEHLCGGGAAALCVWHLTFGAQRSGEQCLGAELAALCPGGGRVEQAAS